MSLSSTPDSALTPIHRIGAVANLCGVPVATLRVWERRYGVVAPPSTAGANTRREISSSLTWNG